jgi:hypothetical protein
MHNRYWTAAWIGAAALTLVGCATGEEWSTWRSHPTHFASARHMGFSVRNRDNGSPRVQRRDIVLAGDEGWWGKPVTVSQERILER